MELRALVPTYEAGTEDIKKDLRMSLCVRGMSHLVEVPCPLSSSSFSCVPLQLPFSLWATRKEERDSFGALNGRAEL